MSFLTTRGMQGIVGNDPCLLRSRLGHPASLYLVRPWTRMNNPGWMPLDVYVNVT